MLRRPAIIAVTFLGLCLLTGCTPEDAFAPPPAIPSQTVSLRDLVTPTASDGGRAEVAESAISSYEDRFGWSYDWAVGIENTSATDLLLSVAFDDHVADAAGKAESRNWTLYTILPGQTMYHGNQTGSNSTEPVTIAPVVTEASWIPMASLAAQNVEAGFDLTKWELGREGGEYVAHVSLRSRGTETQSLDVMVLFRNTRGELLGAMDGTTRGITDPGDYDIEETFRGSWWLPAADLSASAVTVRSTCCPVVYPA